MEVKSVSGSEEFVAGVRTNTQLAICNVFLHFVIFCIFFLYFVPLFD